ncbi:CinA-like protein [Dyadobacter sp. CECT 9275]|uniref:CinA-like protein n=1 Tax=Dyadobacter helix TaxID=2822344 RepID=A0A916JIE7_9BACT|nr:CinA family protein [Dyadobacter sp. CECT 9275]CAG5018301.1 CinA-like protein [Dyadobacter sp. CECT 9275]
MPSQSVIECSSYLKKRGFTIAFAESATAGRLAFEFSMTEASGDILKGGLVCYDASIKEAILKIPAGFIEKYTPESAEVTEAMAFSLQKLMPASIHVAVTGLTTAGGSETYEKPVGTMFIQILTDHHSIALREVFTGNAEEIVMQTINKIAHTITRELLHQDLGDETY